MTNDSIEYFKKSATMGQQLAAMKENEIFAKLAGSDPETSESIGMLSILIDKGIIPKSPAVTLMLDLLDVRRKALWATSDKTNEFTKLGLQMPRKEVRIVDD